ncbi:MAG TPA: hypothetical protein PLJ83_02995, partial [Spirochaetales bacterium]|nr:hypothetical protein [Spirochaetales bacterium]
MTFFTRRYLEEFFLYSSQFVLFYTIALLAAPPVLRPELLPVIVLIISLFIQIALLARFGHRPLARLVFSCITPIVYTLSKALVSPGTLADMASYFLWGISLYQGSIQALELVFRRKWPKRIAEIFMTAGTILSFVFFYFYMDLRIRLFNSYLSGELDYSALSQALTIKMFIPSFINFLKPVQHIFFIFGEKCYFCKNFCLRRTLPFFPLNPGWRRDWPSCVFLRRRFHKEGLRRCDRKFWWIGYCFFPKIF